MQESLLFLLPVYFTTVHGTSECIEHVQTQPVFQIFTDWAFHHYGSTHELKKFYSFQLLSIDACFKKGWRVFWIMGAIPNDRSLEWSSWESLTLPPLVMGRNVICAPSSCGEHEVASWFAYLVQPPDFLHIREPSKPHIRSPPRLIRGTAKKLLRWSAWRVSDLPLGGKVKFLPVFSVAYYFGDASVPSTWAPARDLPWKHLRFIFEHRVSEKWTVPPLSPLSMPKDGVAICFAGDWRMKPDVMASVRLYLVDAIAADVFGVFSRVRHPGHEQVRFQSFFPSTREVRFVEDMSERDIMTMLARVKRWHFYNAQQVFGPKINANQLHFYRKQATCLDLMAEYERKRGYRYSRVVFSRIDSYWAAHHPPLYLMDEQFVWISCDHISKMQTLCDGDGAGFDDKHAVLTREQAEIYMRRWDLLLEGAATLLPFGGGHVFLMTVLRQFNLTVGRFPSVSGLSCCRSAWKCPLHGYNCSADGFRRPDIGVFVIQRSEALKHGATWTRIPKMAGRLCIADASRSATLRCERLDDV